MCFMYILDAFLRLLGNSVYICEYEEYLIKNEIVEFPFFLSVMTFEKDKMNV